MSENLKTRDANQGVQSNWFVKTIFFSLYLSIWRCRPASRNGDE